MAAPQQRTAMQTRTPGQAVPTRQPGAVASGTPPSRTPAATRTPGTATNTPAPRTTPVASSGTPIQRTPSTTAAGITPRRDTGTTSPQGSTTPRQASGVPSSAQGRTAVVPVTRQPVAQPPQPQAITGAISATATNSRVRAPTGSEPVQQRTASGVPQPRTRAPTGSEPVALNDRQSKAVSRARRVSKVIIDKEQKSDYWREIIQEARIDAPELSQEDVGAMIARCLSLELVGDWKVREQQGDAPKARELFGQLSQRMEERLAELNNGNPVRVPGAGFTKIKNMERHLQALEAKMEQDKEEEAAKVQAKISELSKSLSTLQAKKENEREQNRRTMTIEINNLREQMQKATADPTGDTARMAEENKRMAQKMIRLEAALRQMNEERKKGVEDNDTAMLKKKLALFEAKMKQLEEDKMMKQSQDHSDALKDKLLVMEEKLAKMERRKSVSITMMMQQKMQQVEEQLSTLRNTGGGDSASKIAALEKKLVEMQNTKVNPSMINDPETRALRSHVKKMEEAMLAAEQKMEEDRRKLEEERNLALQKRQREEESYRKKAQEREKLLLAKMEQMEKMINQKGGGGGGGGGGGMPAGMDAALQKKIEEMERKMASGGAIADKMAQMERRLRETEQRLLQEKATSSNLLGILNQTEGPERQAIEKDLQIAMLTQSTQELMRRLEETAKQMDDKFSSMNSKIDNMKFTGGAPAAHVHKSGLSYAEINAKLEEIQAKLFDPNIEEKESEQLNIEYEKLISELEGTAEYKAEQEAIAKKWKDENTPLNNAALDRVRGEIAGWTPMKKTAQLKRKPELKFLDFTPDQINKKHVNDFKGVTTQNLTLDEARAIYACMPEFRKDQEAQLQFVGQLKDKIETEAKKPAVKAPPPIKAKKQVVMKKPPASKGGGGGDFLAELLQKRKAVG